MRQEKLPFLFGVSEQWRECPKDWQHTRIQSIGSSGKKSCSGSKKIKEIIPTITNER
jgi:hypothetical protein